MYKNIRYVLFFFVFIFIFINIPVLGYTIKPNSDNFGDIDIDSLTVSDTGGTVTSLEKALRNEYSKLMTDALTVDDSESNVMVTDSKLDIIKKGEIIFGDTSHPLKQEKYKDGFSMALTEDEIAEMFSYCYPAQDTTSLTGGNYYNLTPIGVKLNVNGVDYTFFYYSKYVYEYVTVMVENDDGELVPEEVWTKVLKCDAEDDAVYYDQVYAGYSVPVTISNERLKFQYEIAVATEEFLGRVTKAIRLGLIAGSVSSSYNVGTVYSTTQRPLSDIMQKGSDGGYDFKDSNSMKTAFSYFMNPFLGKVDFIEKAVPKTIDEWTNFVADLNFIDGTSVSINSGYVEFISGLSDEKVNNKGLKIAKDLIFRNGVSAIKDIELSDNPKSVVSYNLSIAVPYIFRRSGEHYTLDKTNLRILDGYTYCVWNDRIYDSNFNEITNRSELSIPRDNLYLFSNYNDENQPVGILLIGCFNECVVDTSNGEDNTGKSSKGYFFDTGRQIGFTNGYSDAIYLNKANKNLMYAMGASGPEAYLLLNVAFPLDEDMSAVLKEITYTSFAERMVWEDEHPGLDFPTILKEDRTNLISFVQEPDNHIAVGEAPKFFKIMIDLVQTQNLTGEKKAALEDNAEEAEKIKAHSSRYAFVIVRNNRYVNDASLIKWLRTDLAQSLTYVDSVTLLERITGDFVSGLDKLSYTDWLRMQEVRSELQHERDSWGIRVINIFSIIIGVALIVFAILICLFYWFDIVNTFTDFSVLQMISLGNLYPVSRDDMSDYMRNKKGDVKYVTFKDVLIIAALLCIVGFLFLESQNVIRFIIWTYQYIMKIVGRLSF